MSESQHPDTSESLSEKPDLTETLNFGEAADKQAARKVKEAASKRGGDVNTALDGLLD
ncbi:hypothetical protein JKY72_06185 [Candidatus Gracilibacteria bacterium]|nr:hypothetical protein [Candidatus Gracilibacteria bacterium]